MSGRARRPLSLLALALLVSLALGGRSRARAEVVDAAQGLAPERDQLLEQLARGADFDAAVARFAALLQRRDKLRLDAAAEARAERERASAEKAAIQARRDEHEAYRRSADHWASRQCRLELDAGSSLRRRHGGGEITDWGPVVRKEVVRLPSVNAFDEGKQITMYEVAGALDHYRLNGAKAGWARGALEADVGDLVLLCGRAGAIEHKLPGEWGQARLTAAVAVRLREPPAIARKQRWSPLHVRESDIYGAIRRVQWTLPPDRLLLVNFELGEPLGDGRWSARWIEHKGDDWILEVAPDAANRAALVAGQPVWGIVGQPRFDVALKKLILVGVDFESRYVIER